MHHQIYRFRWKKSQISRTQAHILWCRVPPEKKSAEILGKSIQSAEVHYTKPEDEFRRTIGLNTEFRWDFSFSRSQVHNLCSGVPPENKKLKSAIFLLQSIRGHRISIFRRFVFQQISCPIIGRNGKKVHKVRRDLFGKLIWDCNTKFWALDPTLLIGHGWHMWSGGTCRGNPWKIV